MVTGAVVSGVGSVVSNGDSSVSGDGVVCRAAGVSAGAVDVTAPEGVSLWHPHITIAVMSNKININFFIIDLD